MRSKYIWLMIAALIVLAALFRGIERLKIDPIGLDLTSGWHVRSLVVWRQAHPDMLALSPSRKWLYVSCETDGGIDSPSLAAINLQTGHHQILISGLMRADGLKFAPDSSLWIGEEFPQGLIWRIANVDQLPVEQKVDRSRMVSSHDAIAPFRAAGRFAHEGITFSRDRRFAYLADEATDGALYRLRLYHHQMSVLNDEGQWHVISGPMQAREAARRLHAMHFNRIEDMETLPDGRILMAETGTGRILLLDDRSAHPAISTYLHDTNIAHPDNLAWDARRKWLWITDDSSPSALWAWDGRQMMRIASHAHAEITGVLALGDNIYLNLQNRKNGPELTLRLYQTNKKNTL